MSRWLTAVFQRPSFLRFPTNPPQEIESTHSVDNSASQYNGALQIYINIHCMFVSIHLSVYMSVYMSACVCLCVCGFSHQIWRLHFCIILGRFWKLAPIEHPLWWNNLTVSNSPSAIHLYSMNLFKLQDRSTISTNLHRRRSIHWDWLTISIRSCIMPETPSPR